MSIHELYHVDRSFYQNAFIIACALAVLLTSYAEDKLPDDDCHVVPQCNCSGWISVGERSSGYSVGVLCSYQRFDKVPTFRNTTYKMSRDWTIDFQRNRLSYIPDNAFSDLQNYGNDNNVSVILDNNDLYSENISDSAFSGIEKQVVALSLRANHLTYIPTVVSRLPNLQSFNVYYNPLQEIDPAIFVSIYGTLKRFEIPVEDLSIWPTTLLQRLTALNHLKVSIRNETIPDGAFAAFYDTLRRLEIRCVHMNAMPKDVCNLRRLETLAIRRNYRLGQFQLFCKRTKRPKMFITHKYDNNDHCYVSRV